MQSKAPSQRYFRRTQLRDVTHWNVPSVQLRGGQPASSVLSRQSLPPSQTHMRGTQRPLPHWNSASAQVRSSENRNGNASQMQLRHDSRSHACPHACPHSCPHTRKHARAHIGFCVHVFYLNVIVSPYHTVLNGEPW